MKLWAAGLSDDVRLSRSSTYLKLILEASKGYWTLKPRLTGAGSPAFVNPHILHDYECYLDFLGV